MRKISLNVSKSIGKVVFIVEGDKKEHSFLGHIFMNILDYSIVEVKRKRAPYEKYVSKSNQDSRIFVVSAETSNVKSAGEEGKDYLDRVFSTLYGKYDLDITNAAVYYIFDRDNESNMYSETEKRVHVLKNSRDNGIEANGLLLLSYPCIEAYIKTCIDDCINEMVDTPKSLKLIVGDARYQYSRIDGEALIKACNNMLLGIKNICGRDLKIYDLDDFSEICGKVLEEENTLYLTRRQYMILSMVSIALIDLGILVIEN